MCHNICRSECINQVNVRTWIDQSNIVGVFGGYVRTNSSHEIWKPIPDLLLKFITSHPKRLVKIWRVFSGTQKETPQKTRKKMLFFHVEWPISAISPKIVSPFSPVLPWFFPDFFPSSSLGAPKPQNTHV